MICKNCFYYTGIHCHGHGEYWGSCRIIKDFLRVNNLDKMNEDFSYNYDLWADVKYDNTKCFFNDILKLNGDKYEVS